MPSASHLLILGTDQERNRGALLHKLACQRLGYADNHYSGQFPDIRRQLLEVKFKTSPTIDPGLVKPDSTEVLDLPEKIQGGEIQPCDVRYEVFYAKTDGKNLTLTHLFVNIGQKFFGSV